MNGIIRWFAHHGVAAVLLIGVFLTHLWDVRRQKQASGKTWKDFVFGPDSSAPAKSWSAGRMSQVMTVTVWLAMVIV